jgi:hypothetical protein
MTWPLLAAAPSIPSASLDIASAVYLQAIVKYPLRNVRLHQGEHIIKRHDGEPKPEPPKDPNLKSWSAHLIGGKKMQLLGYVEGVSEPAAIEAAVVLFSLDDRTRRRVVINLRR